MFSRFNETTHEFNSTHIADPDGGNEIELTLPGPEGGGRWSSDGKHIAVMTILEGDRVGTAIISPDGTVERTLAIPDPTLNLVCVTWSPDDLRLACEGWDDTDESRTGIYVVNASDGGDLVRLTTPPAGLVDFPGDFSPDGRSFVFNRAEDEAPGPLLLVDVAGGEPQQIGSGTYEDPGRFSPDGTSLATAGDGKIVVLDLEGNVRSEIKRARDFLFGPAWSPDGQWLAYSGASIGPHADVFISHPDGSDLHRITDTPENEIVVEWSHPS
jgi:Tol biopolymer transport system component